MRIGRTALAVMLILALAAPAQAAQLDPRTAPVTSGPLTEDNATYDGKRCSRNEMMDLDNEVVIAVTKYCWTFLRLDPAAETDTASNYGVWWIQSVVKPKNGWCAKKVVTHISMDNEAALHRISGRDFETENATQISPKLRVQAEGTATTKASVRQSLKLLPTTMVTKLVTRTNSQILKLVWGGATRRAVAAAGGVEGSWAADAAPPIFVPGMTPRMVSSC